MAQFGNIKDLVKQAFIEKAYTEGIYADTPANRKLGRVGMTYAAYAEKVKNEKSNSSDNDEDLKELIDKYFSKEKLRGGTINRFDGYNFGLGIYIEGNSDKGYHIYERESDSTREGVSEKECLKYFKEKILPKIPKKKSLGNSIAGMDKKDLTKAIPFKNVSHRVRGGYKTYKEISKNGLLFVKDSGGRNICHIWLDFDTSKDEEVDNHQSIVNYGGTPSLKDATKFYNADGKISLRDLVEKGAQESYYFIFNPDANASFCTPAYFKDFFKNKNEDIVDLLLTKSKIEYNKNETKEEKIEKLENYYRENGGNYEKTKEIDDFVEDYYARKFEKANNPIAIYFRKYDKYDKIY